jgi:hypothetical protein
LSSVTRLIVFDKRCRSGLSDPMTQPLSFEQRGDLSSPLDVGRARLQRHNMRLREAQSADYDIEAPNSGFATAEDHGTIELQLRFTRLAAYRSCGQNPPVPFGVPTPVGPS